MAESGDARPAGVSAIRLAGTCAGDVTAAVAAGCTGSRRRRHRERWGRSAAERDTLVPGPNVDIGYRRIRLSELGGRTYVLARGGFQLSASGEQVTTFLAAYGDQSAVRIRCATSGLRGEVPEVRFWARCLGTVQGWDRDTGHLVVDPIAIFK